MNINVDRNRFTASDIDAVEKYLYSNDGQLSYYGDEGLQHEYEQALANYFCRKRCLLMNSGTNSLLAAYFGLKISYRDEVLVPAHSFYAVATPLLLLGAIPVVVDCDTELGLIEVSDAEHKITPNTKAIVVNHLCGHPADMQKIKELAMKYNLKIVEDLSLSIASTIDGKLTGTFGDVACFSLGSTKILSGGQGGALITDDEEVFERAVLLGCFGKRAYQNVINPFYRQFIDGSYGTNCRMHSLAIAISYARFKNLNNLIKDRHDRFNMISEVLKRFEFIDAPKTLKGCFRGSWHGYYALYNQGILDITTNRITELLNEKGLNVNSGTHYTLLHKMPVITRVRDGFMGMKDNANKRREERAFSCPHVEEYNKKTISFPLFLDEDIEAVEKYCLTLRKALEEIERDNRLS